MDSWGRTAPAGRSARRSCAPAIAGAAPARPSPSTAARVTLARRGDGQHRCYRVPSPLMDTVDNLRHTPLRERHVSAGARLVDFAGWEMPVQYEGIRQEHLAVR